MTIGNRIRLRYHTMKLRALCWILRHLMARAEKLARPEST
jgi:hypothetical protein